MKRVRVIPTLLIQRGGLVKSIKFRRHTYVGDPINAVKIFNDKEVDEIVILDISATSGNRGPDMKQVEELASEAFMPMAYGGGITSMGQISELIRMGVEKVVLNTVAFKNPQLVLEASKFVGSQSVVVSMDVKRNLWGNPMVYVQNGSRNTRMEPVAYARQMEDCGAGELLVNAIDRDGTFGGYDFDLIRVISKAVGIPVVAIGGASTMNDFLEAVNAGASAVSAGSMFVFQRPHRAVLINYPGQKELNEQLFSQLQ